MNVEPGDMLDYAETSALYAFFHPKDEFSSGVHGAVRKHSPDFVYWTFLRYELRHNLRQARGDEFGETAWRALRAAERTQARLRWQPDLKCDSILEAADEFSAQSAREFDAGADDFLHIIAAKRIRLLSGLDAFWTCDSEQAKAATANGLPARLFEI